MRRDDRSLRGRSGPANPAGLSLWTVAATYMGTVVGAGFASGQEVLRFFSHFGGRGTVGLAAAGLLLMAGGAGMCELGRRTRATSFGEVLLALGGPLVGRFLDGTMAFLLFGGTVVMTAGSGALFREHLGLGEPLGSAVLVLAAVVTVAFGLRGVVAANRAVVPLLVTAVLVVAVANLGTRGLPLGWHWWQPAAAAHPWWPVSALLYASYNLFLSLGVLAPLGATVRSARTVALGGVLGGVGLGAAALAVHLAILSSLPTSAALAVPMLEAAAVLPRWARTGYALVLFAEIYTTAVANLFALQRRLLSRGSRTGPKRLGALAALGLLALLASRLGFPRLVVTIYPLAGYVGFLVLLGLPVALWRTRRV